DRISSRIKGFLSSHAYSYHLYKKIHLILSAKLSGSGEGRVLTRNLENEEGLLQKSDAVANLAEQTISPVTPVPDRASRVVHCVPPPPLSLIKSPQQEA